MKKIILVFLLIGGVCTILLRNNNKNIKSPVTVKPFIKIKSNQIISTSSLFSPYWTPEVSEKDLIYDTYYYFGIRPTQEGNIDTDEGFKHLSLVQSLPSKKKELVLRMLDSSVTEVLLQDKTAQKTLVSEVKSILSKNTFSGIVLDIEVPFTLQADKEKQITNFVQQMCTAVHINYKSCSMLVYGDVIYRKRPYDLKKLSSFTDRILLMAYDFHKAGGEPGPNFPLSRRGANEGGPSTIDYDYDFKQMILDVASIVPKEKIEVVFGMYGYDWTMNEQGMPLKTAKALTLNEIKTKIQVPNSNSNKLQSNDAKEKNILYIDSDGQKHVIWYEDEESAQIKTEYLLQQGIGRVSFWARSYF